MEDANPARASEKTDTSLSGAHPAPPKDGQNGELPLFRQSHASEKGHGGFLQAAGESGRHGFHPLLFLSICFRSSCNLSRAVNVLWPLVPAAIAVHFAVPDMHVTIFVLNYLAMIPAANTIGFAGQELARKIPKVIGVIMETTLGSIVEFVLFIVLIVKGDDYVPVVKAAILGSILANLLLCLGLCFIAGGIRHAEQEFHAVVSEVGSGLMLVAGVALVIPAILAAGLNPKTLEEQQQVGYNLKQVSRGVAILLLIAYVIYVYFQTSSHHGLYDEILEADEEKDRDKEEDMAKNKLTATEAFIALAISLACVSMIAVFLVAEIPHITARGVSDAFMGLILVPLVEKAAEHITAVDEAWDNQANFALAHVLGSSIQTALLNTPIVVIVGWGLGRAMDLNFHVFESTALILAILVVGNFLRDGKSNYLEGSLCVLVYIIIAICAFYFPMWASEQELAATLGEFPISETVASESMTATATAAARLAMRTLGL